MRYKFYVNFLRLLKSISSIFQIGNPKCKAPKTTLKPLSEEKVEVEKQELSGRNVWKLTKVICTASYGGSVINQSNEVYNSFLAFPWGASLHPSLSLPFLGRKKTTLKKAIFLITPEAKGNYYHWVIDLLPRLLLIQEYQIKDFHEYEIILHYPEKKYENETLALIGIESKKVVRLKPFEFVLVETLLITDFVNDEALFPQWKRHLLEKVKLKVINNATTINFKKIYLLRGKQKKRRLIGEEDLVVELEQRGFQIIDLQQLSFAEQVRSLQSAEIVIGLHGAALTNIIFCQEHTLIIELRSSMFPPEFYSIIARAYNLRFEAIQLKPEHKLNKQHLANKENLIITEEDRNLLFSKIRNYE